MKFSVKNHPYLWGQTIFSSIFLKKLKNRYIWSFLSSWTRFLKIDWKNRFLKNRFFKKNWKIDVFSILELWEWSHRVARIKMYTKSGVKIFTWFFLILKNFKIGFWAFQSIENDRFIWGPSYRELEIGHIMLVYGLYEIHIKNNQDK